jgi:aspartate-semialdehyde dehydrogenase
MVAMSYQAAGGAGQGGIDELLEQARQLLERDPDDLVSNGAEAEAGVDAQNFSKAIAFNVLAHCGNFTDAAPHRRGVEARQRVAQDPRAARPEGLADLRAGAGGRRATGSPPA